MSRNNVSRSGRHSTSSSSMSLHEIRVMVCMTSPFYMRVRCPRPVQGGGTVTPDGGSALDDRDGLRRVALRVRENGGSVESERRVARVDVGPVVVEEERLLLRKQLDGLGLELGVADGGHVVHLLPVLRPVEREGCDAPVIAPSGCRESCVTRRLCPRYPVCRRATASVCRRARAGC